MLASVYSYRVIVKSVSSCCVRGRRVLSNPVTYYDYWHSRVVYSDLLEWCEYFASHKVWYINYVPLLAVVH